MFKKLRNKLILTNLGITSVVLVVVFTAVYLISTNAAKSRLPAQSELSVFESTSGIDVNKIITFTVHEEKRAAARDLLAVLAMSGVAIEIAVLVISYLMAEQAIRPVREAYNTQKVFIANASHEIKTPLAAIQANLEAADIHGNRWIDNVNRETEKLAQLNGELLALARTDLVTDAKPEDTDVAELVREGLESFTPRMQKLKITRKIIKTQKVKINRGDFMQIFSCLMDNAVKYAGTKVKIELLPHELIISNDGAKIRPEDLPRVFDRFYQTDKTAEGVGLGLSIAKSLAGRNGWKLTAKSGRETTFKLSY